MWDYKGAQQEEAEQETYDFIRGLIRVAKPSVCVETGTAGGKGAIEIATALDANNHGTLYTVDVEKKPRPSHPKVVNNLMDSLEFVRKFDKPIDLAFVDCVVGPSRSLVVVELLEKGTEWVLLHDANFFHLLDVLPTPTFTFDTPRGLAVWHNQHLKVEYEDMEYTELTTETQQEMLRNRIRTLEQRHFELTVQADLAPKLPTLEEAGLSLAAIDEQAKAETENSELESVEKQIKLLKDKLKSLEPKKKEE